ncbi:MAG: hypothetical protein J6U97_05085 [Bacteroidaceae bacterium]|nr:hypothetical protein [Bacteroidaceae bacterium]
MKYCNKEYYVINAIMDQDFRLSPAGIAGLFQDCFATYMAHHHCAAFDLRRQSRMWIISDFSFKVSDIQPFWGETVKVELWVSEQPAVKVYADFRIWHNGNIVASGDSTWAMLDIEKRTPVRANSILHDVEVCNELIYGTHKRKQPASGSFECRHKHITNRSDADFNHHVTNMTYLYVCLAALPGDYLQSHLVSELSIKFKQESFIGEELECSAFRTDETDLWNYEIVTAGERVSCVATIRYTEKPENIDNIDYDNLSIRGI